MRTLVEDHHDGGESFVPPHHDPHLLHAIFDALSIPVAYVDKTLALRYCSMVTARLLGRRVDEVEGHSLHEIAHRYPAVIQAVEQVLESGEPHEHTIWVSPQDAPGSPHQAYHIKYRPYRDAPDSVTGCILEASEVTEQARIVTAMARQSAQLEATLEAMPDAVVVCDTGGEIVQTNAVAERILDCAQCAERPPLSARLRGLASQGKDGTPINDEAFPHTRALHGEVVHGMVLSWELHSGTGRQWFTASAAPMHDDANEIVGAVVAFTDVTGLVEARQQIAESQVLLEEQAAELEMQAAELEEQATELQIQNDMLMQAEAQLRSERELLQTIYDSVPVMFSLYDPRMRHITLNKHFEHATGWTQEDTTETNVMDLVYPDPDYRAEVSAYMASLQPGYRDVKMVTKQGDVIETSWANIRIADGRQVGIGLDITERKLAEEALLRYAAEQERLNDKNRMLLREVNHRVKNNLTAILGLIYAEMTHLDPEHAARCQCILDDLLSRVQSLAAAHTLLSASGWQPLSISDLAGQVVRAATAGARGLRDLVVDVTPSPVRVEPEQAHHLALALGELTTNTVKYGCQDSVLNIHVEARREDNQLCVIYSDSGPGYPPGVLTGQEHSVGLDLIASIVKISLRGTWRIRNEHGAVTELCFPLNPDQEEGEG